MGKESVVTIGGHLYRYAYEGDSQKTIYLGPVGDSPPLTEQEFHRLTSQRTTSILFLEKDDTHPIAVSVKEEEKESTTWIVETFTDKEGWKTKSTASKSQEEAVAFAKRLYKESREVPAHTVRRNSKEWKWVQENLEKVNYWRYDEMTGQEMGEITPLDAALEAIQRRLKENPQAKVRYNPGGKKEGGYYNLHVHSNLWYDIWTDGEYDGPIPKKPKPRGPTKAQRLASLQGKYKFERGKGGWSITQPKGFGGTLMAQDIDNMGRYGNELLVAKTTEELEEKIQESMGKKPTHQEHLEVR
jgi:hypothetical protein